MRLWFDFAINLFYRTIRVDRESHAIYPRKLFARKFFESQATVGGSYFGIQVAQQGKRQLVFECFFGMGLGAISADKEHCNIPRLAIRVNIKGNRKLF